MPNNAKLVQAMATLKTGMEKAKMEGRRHYALPLLNKYCKKDRRLILGTVMAKGFKEVRILDWEMKEVRNIEEANYIYVKW